jgi:hypothetical protein
VNMKMSPGGGALRGRWLDAVGHYSAPPLSAHAPGRVRRRMWSAWADCVPARRGAERACSWNGALVHRHGGRSGLGESASSRTRDVFIGRRHTTQPLFSTRIWVRAEGTRRPEGAHTLQSKAPCLEPLYATYDRAPAEDSVYLLLSHGVDNECVRQPPVDGSSSPECGRPRHGRTSERTSERTSSSLGGSSKLVENCVRSTSTLAHESQDHAGRAAQCAVTC